MLRLGEFFRVFQLVASTKRCLSNPPLLSTPFLTIPFFPARLHPSTFNPLLSNSLLHVANASSPQVPPADAYTLPRSHVHHLLLRSGLATRLYGHVTYKREGVCRVLDSSRSWCSVFNPVLSRTRSRMKLKWWWH